MNRKNRMLLSFFAATLSITSVSAQPTLSAATSTPIAGETFYGRICNTTGVAAGVSGASVTWDFSTFVQVGMDTTSFTTCSATPYCDSFPGSNLATCSGGDCAYFVTSTSGMIDIGAYVPGLGYEHFSDPQEILFYPLSYMSSHSDDAIAVINASPALMYLLISETTNADAWGTLMLPGITYTNALRLHKITVITDSFVTPGSPTIVTHSQNENYDWFVSGIHSPILDIQLDTAGTGAPHVTGAKYTIASPTGIRDIVVAQDALQVYPDPATDVINIKFTLQSPSTSAITITDVTGRTIANISGDKLASGVNLISYPVTELPTGMYIVHLRTADGMVAKKIIVDR